MSERISTPQHGEINKDDRIRFINRIQELSPYNNQPISDFGVFKTSFEREDGYVDIYRPVSTVQLDDEDMLDDAYAVAVRHEDELEDGHVIIRTNQYIVRAATMETDYLEQTMIIGPDGNRIPEKRPTTLEEISSHLATTEALGTNIFTSWRYQEVMRILDEFTPEDGYAL